MPQKRPIRPLPATLISALNAALVLAALAAHFAIRAWHEHEGYISNHRRPANALHDVLSPLAYILAAATAVALWQMHRSAAYLSTGRAILVALELLASLTRRGFPILTIADLLVALAIAAYCFYATDPSRLIFPKSSHRRRRRRRSSQPQSQTEPQPESQPLTTSQFYLANHEDLILRKSPEADSTPDARRRP